MTCGQCGHPSESHCNFGSGACGYRIRSEGGGLDYEWRCSCPRFARLSFGALFALRVAVILACCAVLATAQGLWGWR